MGLTSKTKESNHSFDALFEEFMHQIRLGTAPSIEEFAAQNPSYSDEIRCHFPGLVAAEKLSRHTLSQNNLNLNLPMQIGNFKLVEEIGRGGMAVVYRAMHTHLAREFAVKVMSKDAVNSNQSEERFKLEAQVISKLHHPSIVPLFDFGSHDDLYFIAMRMINGLTFSQIFSQWQSPVTNELDAIKGNWRVLAGFFHEIATALDHVHKAGLNHRDIKPSNLMVDADSRVWITDFGLANFRELDNTIVAPDDFVGTPRYIAPEAVQNSADQRSDVFSLGVTMFEMFSGGRAGGKNWQIPNQLNASTELREINKQVPRALAKIVSKATYPDPADRYQTAKQLANDLKKYILGKKRSFWRNLARFRFNNDISKGVDESKTP